MAVSSQSMHGHRTKSPRDTLIIVKFPRTFSVNQSSLNRAYVLHIEWTLALRV